MIAKNLVMFLQDSFSSSSKISSESQMYIGID